ncbi:MAG: homocysteine S-methyltransferase family protein [Actinomycetota bacterium]|jgi:homocysteine S-methyltransferase
MSSSYTQLKQRLDRGEILVLDGATGTELQRRGAPMDPAAWCGPATLHNDDLLTEIHSDYIRAGSDVITANTFASSRLMLGPAGYADRVGEINLRAVEAALRAREQTGTTDRVAVAGSLSHMVPVAAGSATVDAAKVPSNAEVSDAFYELANILRDAGVDHIMLEMMYNPVRAKLALEAALSTGLPVWFGMSARRAADGRVISFDALEEVAIATIAGLIPAQGVDAAGFMHTGAEIMSEALTAARPFFAGPLMAYPDSGYFEMPDWRFVDTIEPNRLQEFFSDWMQQGVQLIGGCCGLTISHVEAAVRARAGRAS